MSMWRIPVASVKETDCPLREGPTRVLESSNSILKIHDGIVIDNPASPSFEILNEVDTSGSHDEGTVVGDGLRRSGR